MTIFEGKENHPILCKFWTSFLEWMFLIQGSNCKNAFSFPPDTKENTLFTRTMEGSSGKLTHISKIGLS